MTHSVSLASHQLGGSNLPEGYVKADASTAPLGMEIVLVTDDVEAAFEMALSAGSIQLKSPVKKLWGQVVAYVRCPDGLLVELCSSIG